MSSVPKQIDAVVDGWCDSAEVTREDFYAWQNNLTHDGDKCVPQLSSARLAKRSRGMMTTANNTCVIYGINTLFAQLTVKQCDNTTMMCDAQDLHLKYFPETACIDVIKQAFSIEPLDIIDLLGAYIILFSFMLMGAIGSCLGSANRSCHIPGFNRAFESKSATVARELEKVQAQQESQKYFELVSGEPGEVNKKIPNKRPVKSEMMRVFQTTVPIIHNAMFQQPTVEPPLGQRGEEPSPYAI